MYAISIPIESSYMIMRTISLLVLVCFSVVAFLGFSIFLDLRPMQAYAVPVVVVGDPYVVAQTIAQKAMEFIKAIAKAVVLEVIARFMLEKLQILEKVHTIGNIMYYADALLMDQYIGNKLNKDILQPKGPSQVKDAPELTNINSIIYTSSLRNLQNMTPGDIQRLAMLSGGNADVQLWADKIEIRSGESVNISWQVDRQDVTVTMQEGTSPAVEVQSVGAVTRSPRVTTDYFVNAYSGSTLVGSAALTIIVDGAGKDQAKPKGIAGLQRETERQLLLAGVARLTSVASCGGVDSSYVRNVAAYSAARARGFSYSDIDSSNSLQYYQQMAMLGNPYTTRQYQELTMRDYAAQAESAANLAVQNELLGSGNRVPRVANSNTVITALSGINARISASLDKLLETKISGSDTTFSGFAANIVGKVLGDIIFSAIFSNTNARFLAENPYCGITPSVTPSKLTSTNNYGTGTSTQDIDGQVDFNTPFIRVLDANGHEVNQITEGEAVTLQWSVGSLENFATADPNNFRVCINDICGLGPSGTIAVTPPVGDTQYKLNVTDLTTGRTDLVGTAFVQVLSPSPTPTLSPDDESGGGGKTGVGASSILLSPGFRVRE